MSYQMPSARVARGLLVVLLCFFLAHGWAQTSTQTQERWDVQMARLLDDQLNAQGAYQRAQEPDAATHPDYGLWRGIAAQSLGKLAEAMPLLETFIQANPKHPQLGRAQLELGRIYILAGQMGDSEPLFEAVLRTNPPTSVVNNIRMWQALAQVQTKPLAVRSFVEVGFGRDSNPAGGLTSATVSLPGLGLVTLDPSSVRKASNAHSIELFSLASYKLNNSWSLLGQGSIAHHGYAASSDLNLLKTSARAGASWRQSELMLKMLLNGDILRLGDSRYSDYLGVSADVSWQLNPQSMSSLVASTGDLRYAGANASRDGVSRSLGMTFAQDFQDPLRTQAAASVSRGSEDNAHDLSHLGRDIDSLQLRVVVQPSSRTSLTLSRMNQWIRHQGDDPLLLLTRRDVFAETGLTLAYALDGKTSLSAGYSMLKNRSNVELWAFSRNIASLKLRYQF